MVRRSGQVVTLKARPAMDAAVMSFHLSLSPTSSSSLTRFRLVVMPYNDKLALIKFFSILFIHRCFGRPTGRFPVGFQIVPIMNYGWPPLFVHSGDNVYTISFSFSGQCSYFLPCPYPHLHIAYSILKLVSYDMSEWNYLLSTIDNNGINVPVCLI